MIGSAMSGSLGFNAHYANIIAALFIATGQDPAHVVEGSMGITTVRYCQRRFVCFGLFTGSYYRNGRRRDRFCNTERSIGNNRRKRGRESREVC